MPVLITILVGYSVGASALLGVALLSAYRKVPIPWQSRIAGLVMLLGLALTQLGNAELIEQGANHPPGRLYVGVLFAQSWGFYWLLLGVLRPADRWQRIEWALPLLVLVLALLTPLHLGVAVSLGMGTVFATHLSVLLYRLRSMRRWFVVELPVICCFALMGLIVAVVGLLCPSVFSWAVYAWTYVWLIAIGFFLVCWLLLAVPDLAHKALEAVSERYSQTTLSKVDTVAAIARLRKLFEVDHIYRDDSLGLPAVAELMELSTHQVSELINHHMQTRYSDLVRHYRVEAAKRILIAEPKSSVLAVALEVGFSSQSTFYVAFKDSVGVVPGKFRRAHRSVLQSSDSP